tara:strand:+ start:92473 stop:92949 length:477 start_codon:yes stop_codon:yes gene_type:complete
MPKYRLLTIEELNDLEKEFIDFLVINGVTADEWEKLKKDEKEKAEKILEQFSDVVWEGVLRKTKFLEHRSPQEIRAFQCLQGKIILMGLKVKDPTIDLTTKDGFKRIQTNTPTLSVYNSEKLYSRKREEEMFDLIQSGAIISDGNLFKTIALMVADES